MQNLDELTAAARSMIEASSIPEPNTGCWLWLGPVDRRGYGMARGLERRAHRASYAAFCGPIPDGLWILHRCDQPGCVNPDHLWAGTSDENVVDRQKKHRQARGETAGMSVLTDADVVYIKANYIPRSRSNGAVALSERFGVHLTTIYRVLRGELWTHVCSGNAPRRMSSYYPGERRKLTKSDALSIRQRVASGESWWTVSKDFAFVDWSTVRDVVKGKTFKNVQIDAISQHRSKKP